MRHRIVAKAEHDAVERLAGNVLDGVALGQFDVRPALALAPLARPAQHPARQVHAIDRAGGPDRLAQEREVAASAAADFEHALARLKVQSRDRASTQVRRQKQQPVEQADQAGKAIVTACNERRVAIDPLIGHVCRPRARAASGCRLPWLKVFPSLHAPLVRAKAVAGRNVKRARYKV